MRFNGFQRDFRVHIIYRPSGDFRGTFQGFQKGFETFQGVSIDFNGLRCYRKSFRRNPEVSRRFRVFRRIPEGVSG